MLVSKHVEKYLNIHAKSSQVVKIKVVDLVKYLKIHTKNAQIVKIKVVDLVESFQMVVSRPLYDQIRPLLGHFYVLRVSFLITIFLITMGGGVLTPA